MPTLKTVWTDDDNKEIKAAWLKFLASVPTLHPSSFTITGDSHKMREQLTLPWRSINIEGKLNSIFWAAIAGLICRSQSLAVGQPEAGWQRELGCWFLQPTKIYGVPYTTAIGVFSPNCWGMLHKQIGSFRAVQRVTYSFTSSLISSDTRMGLALLSFSLNE